MGEYCSYCEARLSASLAVEHVRPKKPQGATQVDLTRLLSWDNFLLACTNCNSTKGNTDVVITDYLWPDCDNTFSAFIYSEGGIVSARESTVTIKAQNMITLVGLDKRPDTTDASDRRWLNRKEVWDIAVLSRERLANNDIIALREQIIETAKGYGYWSVWMTVFANDADMLARFFVCFPGTSPECFDNHYAPVTRPGGQCWFVYSHPFLWRAPVNSHFSRVNNVGFWHRAAFQIRIP
nr:HNH endonuclease [Providencia rettgeri]